MKNAFKLFKMDLKKVAKTPAVWIILAGFSYFAIVLTLGLTYGQCGIHMATRDTSRSQSLMKIKATQSEGKKLMSVIRWLTHSKKNKSF